MPMTNVEPGKSCAFSANLRASEALARHTCQTESSVRRARGDGDRPPIPELEDALFDGLQGERRLVGVDGRDLKQERLARPALGLGHLLDRPVHHRLPVTHLIKTFHVAVPAHSAPEQERRAPHAAG